MRRDEWQANRKFSPPILTDLQDSKNVLVLGVGGYAIYAGIPILLALKEAKKQVHLASISDFEIHENSTTEVLVRNYLTGIEGKSNIPTPEGVLATHLYVSGEHTQKLWIFKKSGVVPLKYCYEKLVDKLKIDSVVIVGNGTTGVMAGTEEGAGDCLDGLVALSAVANANEELNIRNRIMTCYGFGTEMERNVGYTNFLRNTSNITGTDFNSFLGACSLQPNQRHYNVLNEAYNMATSKYGIPGCQLISKLLNSACGQLCIKPAGQNPELHPANAYISLLATIYWFFNVDSVYENNGMAQSISRTVDYDDVRMAYRSLWYANKLKLVRRQNMPY